VPLSTTLLEIESQFISQHISGVSSITFYKGNLLDTALEIKDRFALILEKNPWLAGKLIRVKGQKSLELVYPDITVENIPINELFSLNPPVKVHSTMAYSLLGEACIPLIVQKPKTIIKQNEFVTKLSLVEDAQDKENRFSLIFSLSHSIADGYTYYTILNMLCKDAPIYALDVERKKEVHQKALLSLGKQEYAFLNGFAHIFNAIRGVVFGKKARIYAFYLDEEKISTLKNELPKEEGFISTNDIISSSYFSFIGARLCAMAINFRFKIKGLSHKDAGNYEGAILYDKKRFTKPSNIRKSLLNVSSYIGHCDPLPKTCEGMFCKIGLITNWASFAKNIDIHHCEQLLHLPLTNTTGRMPYEMAVIFRAKEGKTGIIYYTQRFKKEDFNSQKLPISTLISDKIFA